MKSYPFYWDASDWKARTGELILDFSIQGGVVICGGIWRVQAVLDGGALLPVEYERKPLGLNFPQSDARKLAKRIHALVKNGMLKVDGTLVSIEAVAGMLLGQNPR